MNNLYYDHPILSIKNIVDLDSKKSRRYFNISPKENKYHKRMSHQKTRRLIKLALKGNKIRCNKIPGNSWNIC